MKFFDFSSHIEKRKSSPLGEGFCCEEVDLELHRFSELFVRDIHVEPGGGPGSVVAVNLGLVFLVEVPGIS